MLIEFSAGNFRSFKDTVTLSMLATRINARDPQIDQNNIFDADEQLKLLTTAAVYGANASGKSNLVSALAFMRTFVINSSRESQAAEPVPVEHFRLSSDTTDQPSLFQMVFLAAGQKYRYGFEVTRQQVVTEWLFVAGTRKERRLFTRDEQGIHLGRSFKEGYRLEPKTRPNALFLSVCAQFNGEIANQVMTWFRNLRTVSGLDDTAYLGFTLDRFQNQVHRQQIIDLVRSLDVGIDDITSEKLQRSQVLLPPELPREIQDLLLNTPQDFYAIRTAHKRFDAAGQPVGVEIFDLQNQESHGTQKLFFLAGPLLDTLSMGRVLFVDELEARLHPLITAQIIRLFHSHETNPHHAQLVFTTHDTNLLSNKRFRRDQVWFTEKDALGATHLYALSDFKVRNDASFESDYIQGKYGAIPFLGDLKRVVLEDDAA